ncbi:MAG: hypothetical protein EOO16_02925 [Chitinophagaceae bacterium]|nr:MAG: hypothetical protein EOO16_02925 [Chitinophagaceae bacterium]
MNRTVIQASEGSGKLLLQSAVLTAVFFAALLLLLRPAYGTVEDAFVLYQLGGGFGAPPTHLLHYNHILNPLVGAPIAALFRQLPGINWYTTFLFAGHFTACCTICFCLLRRQPLVAAISVYALFFFVFESRFYASLNFSNASVLLAIAALLFLLAGARSDEHRVRHGITGALLLLAAGLFRIHAWLPLLPLAAVFLGSLPGWRSRGQRLLWAGVALLALFAAQRFQEALYTAKLPGWRAEESYRQQLYALYNNKALSYPGPGAPLFLEGQMARTGMVVDRDLLTPEVLRQLAAGARVDQRDSGSLYWLFTNNRIFLIAALLPLLFAATARQRLAGLAALALVGVMATALLYRFGKLPDYLLQGMLATVLLFSFCSTQSHQTARPRLLLPLSLVLAAWGLWVTVKLNCTERSHQEEFRRQWAFFNRERDRLFFVSTDAFALQHFPAWSPPARYPLAHVLTGEHFIQGLEAPVLHRFGLKNLRELPDRNEAAVAGWPPVLIQSYFQRVTGKSGQLAARVDSPLPVYEFVQTKTAAP